MKRFPWRITLRIFMRNVLPSVAGSMMLMSIFPVGQAVLIAYVIFLVVALWER